MLLYDFQRLLTLSEQVLFNEEEPLEIQDDPDLMFFAAVRNNCCRLIRKWKQDGQELTCKGGNLLIITVDVSFEMFILIFDWRVETRAYCIEYNDELFEYFVYNSITFEERACVRAAEHGRMAVLLIICRSGYGIRERQFSQILQTVSSSTRQLLLLFNPQFGECVWG
jgi:hypothetical protein